MECNTSKFHCLNLTCEDLSQLESVSAAYFGAREWNYGTMHYSYDYAQQLHYPSHPLQPCPIYLKMPRKCSLFGVCYEGISRQVNFLIDEIDKSTCIVETKRLRSKETGENFKDSGPVRGDMVAVKTGGKLLDAMVIATDGE